MKNKECSFQNFLDRLHGLRRGSVGFRKSLIDTMTSEDGERVQLEAGIALNGAGRGKGAWKAMIALSRSQG